MKVSNPTKSFIYLVLIAVIGTYACIIIWGNSLDKNTPYKAEYNYGDYNANTQANTQQYFTLPIKNIDTAKWKTYQNKDFNFSFKYNPSWKILPVKTKDEYTIIEVDPGAKYFNFKIYVSPKDFYLMDGIPTKTEAIGGVTAINAADQLYGIHNKDLYYTFDIGWDQTLNSEFNALVHSVKFTN